MVFEPPVKENFVDRAFCMYINQFMIPRFTNVLLLVRVCVVCMHTHLVQFLEELGVGVLHVFQLLRGLSLGIGHVWSIVVGPLVEERGEKN